MARWITQTYKVNGDAQIELGVLGVWIGDPVTKDGAHFTPADLQDAMAMSIALRQAAKRLEDIGRGIK